MPLVEHVVSFRVKDEFRGTERERIALQTIRDLPKHVPGLLSMTVGENFCAEDAEDVEHGFTHALVARLTSREALAAYHDHPVHAVARDEHLLPIITRVTAVDYDLPEDGFFGDPWIVGAFTGFVLGLAVPHLLRLLRGVPNKS